MSSSAMATAVCACAHDRGFPTGVDHARLRAALKPLLALPVTRVLVSHGEPVTEAAHARLAEALAADSEPANV